MRLKYIEGNSWLPAATFAACALLGFFDFRLHRTVSTLRHQLSSVQVKSVPSEGSLVSALRGVDLRGSDEVIELSGGNQSTLLFVLAPNCKYCEEILPAWKTLQASFSGSLVLADLSGSAQRSYFQENFPSAAYKIVLLDPSETVIHGFRGTPLTLLIGTDGRVIKSWAGVMSPREVDVFARILQSPTQSKRR